MKTLKLLIAFSLLAVVSAFAQTQLTVTTLSVAVTKKGSTFVTPVAITGLTVGSFIVVDQEPMQVSSIPTSGTTIGVIRVQRGAFHKSGAPVVLVPAAAAGLALVDSNPTGACARGSSSTAASTVYLPIINQRTGAYSDCINGYFVTGDPLPLNANPTPILNASPGDTIYTSVDTNGVATFSVDTTKHEVKTFLAAMLKSLDVEDVTVEDTPLEDIIHELYIKQAP